MIAYEESKEEDLEILGVLPCLAMEIEFSSGVSAGEQHSQGRYQNWLRFEARSVQESCDLVEWKALVRNSHDYIYRTASSRLPPRAEGASSKVPIAEGDV